MVETIKINNKTNKTVVLYAHDGDNIHIPGRAQKTLIDKKFDWNLPSSIEISKDEVVSTNEPLEARSNLEEAKKRAFARRNNLGDFGEKTALAAATPEPVGDKPVADNVPVESKPATMFNPNTAQIKTPIGGR